MTPLCLLGSLVPTPQQWRGDSAHLHLLGRPELDPLPDITGNGGEGGLSLVMPPYSWGQDETSISSSLAGGGGGGAVHMPPQFLGGPGPGSISRIWDCCYSLPELLELSSFLLPALGGAEGGGGQPSPASTGLREGLAGVPPVLQL